MAKQYDQDTEELGEALESLMDRMVHMNGKLDDVLTRLEDCHHILRDIFENTQSENGISAYDFYEDDDCLF